MRSVKSSNPRVHKRGGRPRKVIDGIKIIFNPLPAIWRYDNDDISTWLWIDCLISRHNEDQLSVRWIKNPEFKYNHLLGDK
jgi:hypothetical protein